MVKLKSRGFTLLELILATSMLALLIIALFEAFDYGAKAFQLATSKQDSQAALTRAYSSLRDDLRRSHFRSVSRLERVVSHEGAEYRRDGLCMAGLIDWEADTSFDEINGLPKWDSYILYYATQDGRLVRSKLELDRPDYSPAPFADLEESTYLNDDPRTNTGYQKSFRVLASGLLDFRVQSDVPTDTVSVRCLLELTSRGKKNRSEFELEVFPQNTWPKGESL